MPLQHLTDEQIRTWSREQKDRWWLANVFRGDMPQLTLRSAITGFLLGGVLSATNLYVGAKTGWTLGVGLTSVILAFAVFRVLARLGARDMTILENNCSQSIATAAGYLCGPLISGITAYIWIENKLPNILHIGLFLAVLAILGVLVAFPMKRRFINDEHQPFPEGRACGVVLDTLYSGDAAVGLFKAKALAIAAAIAGFVNFVSGESYFKAIHAAKLWAANSGTWASILEKFKDKLDATWHVPHHLDALWYSLAAKGVLPIPRIANIDIRQLALRPTLDLAMFGAGGLMGIRAGVSLLIGMVVNFVFVVPWMISKGELLPSSGSVADGTAVFGRAHILNNWALWWGISIMVVASLVSLFSKPQVFIEAFKGVFAKRTPGQGKDVLAHVELPLWISFVGVPVVGAVAVWMGHAFFGVDWLLGALAIPLIIVLTLIAASSTALTGITPTGSLSKIPQFIFGAAAPKHPATNLMTGVMCVEVASNASNLLMDIKPGYMLGAKPRQQAIGHCIGVIAGALAATPLFFVLFLSKFDPALAAADPAYVQNLMVTDQFSFPSAVQWKGVSDLVTSLFGGEGGKQLLTTSIIWSMCIAAFVGAAMEIVRVATKNKFPISPLAIGLGVLVPPDSTMAMFAGAFFFWLMNRLYKDRKQSTGHKLWIDTQEPICAGIIAGAALVGIGDVMVKVFLL